LVFLGVLLVETIDSAPDKTKEQRVTNNAWIIVWSCLGHIWLV
jgi:hypothetical protein